MKNRELNFAKKDYRTWFIKEQMKEEATVNGLLDSFSKAFSKTKSKKPIYKFFKDWENAALAST